MHFVLSAVGSAGDVHPFLAVGRVLLARGHSVTVMAAAPFEGRARRIGAGFVALGLAEDFERLVRRAELWDARLGTGLLFDELLERLPEAFTATMKLAGAADTVLVGSTLSWAVRLVQEKTGLPTATVHLSPSTIISADQPPVLPGVGDVSWVPPQILRMLLSGAERFVIDRRLMPRLNAYRGQLGLTPVDHVLSRWMHSPDLVIGAWPDWFAPPQRDWPEQMVTTGFPVFDEDVGATPGSLYTSGPIDDWTTTFLQAGAAPVGITPGSAMAHGRVFFERALDACESVGQRALLVTPYADQLPATLPSWAHQVAYAPFSALLPCLSAIVHHGGIGTSAQALGAGLPQLVTPFAHDQFDNAARLVRLGVARTVKPDGGRRSWRSAMHSLSEDDNLRKAAAFNAARMAGSGSGPRSGSGIGIGSTASDRRHPKDETVEPLLVAVGKHVVTDAGSGAPLNPAALAIALLVEDLGRRHRS